MVAAKNGKKADAFVQYCLSKLEKDNLDHYFYIQEGGSLIDEETSEQFTSLDSLLHQVNEDTDNQGVKMFYGDCTSKQNYETQLLDLVTHGLSMLQFRGSMLLKL